jgi:hypothetical protein
MKYFAEHPLEVLKLLGKPLKNYLTNSKPRIQALNGKRLLAQETN